MVWVTPVTDRKDGSARMTYNDMNRITGNLEWLYHSIQSSGIPIAGYAISKSHWSRNDIVTARFWKELLTCLENVCTALGYTPKDKVTYHMTWNNINLLEDIERLCHDIFVVYDEMPRLNHYVGDMLSANYLYAGDDINAGGRY
jgi:hypothetical protein